VLQQSSSLTNPQGECAYANAEEWVRLRSFPQVLLNVVHLAAAWESLPLACSRGQLSPAGHIASVVRKELKRQLAFK
jgi:hypothetical protein